MMNISSTTESHNNSLKTTMEILSKAQVIAWSCALASEGVVIVVGNLLTIVLFTFENKLRPKKSLYLVMNMAFADLVLGGVCLPIYLYFLVTHNQLFPGSPIFRTIFTVSLQASFITAALISAERFYAIYWPLKHRTLSSRAYKLIILSAWILAILVFTVYLLPLSPLAVSTFTSVYAFFLVLTICGLNIGIWRKCQQKNATHHQNRALQTQRLTKALLLVSVLNLTSWLPTIIHMMLSIFGYNLSSNLFLITVFIHFSTSFINPMVYALRIPEFKQALSLCCFRRQEMMDSEGNTGRVNEAVDHNNLQLTFEREIVEDTKL